MKRRIALALALLLVMLTAAGCGNSLEDYKNAVEKTGQIAKGQASGEFSMSMDFNTEGMTPQEISELNYYKDMTGSFRIVFDKSKEQEIYRNYLNMGGLGFDFELYKNGDEMFIKLPIVGKYMKIEDLVKRAEQSPGEPPRMISEESAEALSKEWTDILTAENVFKGEDIVLSTPDGEVKTTVYTITLNETQLAELKEDVRTILSEDEYLRENFDAMIKEMTERAEAETGSPGVTAGEVWNQIFMDTVENFQYTAYVDIDGYIVDETIEFGAKHAAAEKGEPTAYRFALDIKKWDINKSQEFEFPELTEENTLKAGELDENMPSLFKDLFRADGAGDGQSGKERDGQ